MDRELMKACFGDSAMWGEWREIGFPREFMQESVVAAFQWVGCGRDGLIL